MDVLDSRRCEATDPDEPAGWRTSTQLCRRRCEMPMVDKRVPFSFVSLWVLTVVCRRQRDGQEQQDGDGQTSHGVEGGSRSGVRGWNLTA